MGMAGRAQREKPPQADLGVASHWQEQEYYGCFTSTCPSTTSHLPAQWQTLWPWAPLYPQGKHVAQAAAQINQVAPANHQPPRLVKRLSYPLRVPAERTLVNTPTNGPLYLLLTAVVAISDQSRKIWTMALGMV